MKRLPIRLSARRRITQAFGSEAQARRGKPKIRNSGQALLVILLIMAVALTIGLAVTSRTVTDVEISGNTEEAARAFSAAEAGIEEALITATSNPGGEFPETGAKFQSAVAHLGEGESKFVFSDVSRDNPQTLWLVEHNQDGTINETAFYKASTINVCWNNPAALEVTIYYKDGTSYKIARGAYDQDQNRRTVGSGTIPPNGFTAADSGCAGLDNGKLLTFNDFGIDSVTMSILFLRLRILYADGNKVGVSIPEGSGGVLSSQGLKIESTGTAGTSTRKVEVIRMHPAPPGIFDFLLYSGSDLKHE